MRIPRVASVLLLGVAACATPGQVRRVETSVAAANADRARGDSAQRAELARIQIAQRQNIDSINALVRQLNDVIQRMSRDNSSNFDDLRQRFYQLSNLASTTQSSVRRLSNQVDMAVTTAAPVGAGTSSDTVVRGSPVPQPSGLIEQARLAMLISAFPTARRALNQLIVTYPQAAEVPDAYYGLGQTFEQDQPDSARIYYTRVYTSYPTALHASSALYKLGNLELKSGNTAAARRAWQMILDKYKDSVEFDPAQRMLRENP